MILTPMVSVVMITYGHEKYIKQAIEGVLMQTCNFEIELIIANDCSADKTDDVIQAILKNNARSSIIRYIRHVDNLGISANFEYALGQAKSKYIALCEGDDYWTDPFKLQKQVDFLEASSKHVLVYHPWQVLDQESNDLQSRLYDAPRTLTILFRNQLSGFTFENVNVLNGDTLLKFYLSTKGEFMCLNDIKPAIHRHHLGGVWSKKDAFYQVSNKLHTIETIVGLYKETEFLDKARFQHVSTLMVLNETKSDTLKEYVIKQSFSGFNSYLRFHGILWIFQKQKLKRFLRVSYESLKRRKHS
jgi:glycosyltransferase involved in cell wall biosynthesis